LGNADTQTMGIELDLNPRSFVCWQLLANNPMRSPYSIFNLPRLGHIVQVKCLAGVNMTWPDWDAMADLLLTRYQILSHLYLHCVCPKAL